MTTKKQSWWERHEQVTSSILLVIMFAGIILAVWSLWTLIITFQPKQPPQLNWTCAESKDLFYISEDSCLFKVEQEGACYKGCQLYNHVIFLEDLQNLNATDLHGWPLISDYLNCTAACDSFYPVEFDSQGNCIEKNSTVLLSFNSTVCTREAAYCNGTPEECDRKYGTGIWCSDNGMCLISPKDGFSCVEWTLQIDPTCQEVQSNFCSHQWYAEYFYGSNNPIEKCFNDIGRVCEAIGYANKVCTKSAIYWEVS